MYLFDLTGKVNKSSSFVVAEDKFDKSMSGFTQLLTPDSDRTTAPDLGRRYVSPLVRIMRSGLPRIALKTPRLAESTSRPIQAMGIKRMNNMYGDGRYLMEMIVSVETEVSQTDRPAAWGWGLDVARDDGVRRFFKVRYLNWDGTSQVRKWQIKTGVGSSLANYTDLPVAAGVGQLDLLTNENKALTFYLALEVNTLTGRFLGFRLGNIIKLGSLADNPDNSLANIPVASEDLTSFLGGVNTCFDVDPRTDASRTQAQSNVHFHRLTYLGQ